MIVNGLEQLRQAVYFVKHIGSAQIYFEHTGFLIVFRQLYSAGRQKQSRGQGVVFVYNSEEVVDTVELAVVVQVIVGVLGH